MVWSNCLKNIWGNLINNVYKHFDEMSKRAATPSRIDDHSCIGSICSKKSNKGAIPYLSVSV